MPDAGNNRRWVYHLALALLVLAVALLAAPRLLSDEPWLAVLKQQLRDQRACIASHIVNVREVSIGAGRRMEGRMRCDDGREFDFTQATPHGAFALRLCEPAVC